MRSVDHSTPTSTPVWAKSRRADLFWGFILGVMLWLNGMPWMSAAPILPGIATGQLSSELKGLILIEELNCSACHAADPALGNRSKKAPRLSGIGSRINPNHLEAFLRNPHVTKAGTTMPDVLARVAETERAEIATAITHFLWSLQKRDFSLEPPDPVAAQHGRILFQSRGCAQCHSPRDSQGTEILAGTSVPLGALEHKYSHKSLVEFLQQPHSTRPSGRMPHLRLSGQDLHRIAHYLLRDTRVPGNLAYTLYRGQVWEGLESETVTAERGGLVRDFSESSLGKFQHHTAVRYEGWLRIDIPGRYTFFLTLNGGSLVLDGTAVLQEKPSDRRGVKELQGELELASGWHSIQLTYFHTGHSPKFSFEFKGPRVERQAIPASMLSSSKEPISRLELPAVDATLAARGREHFGQLGCANCHDDLKIPARTFTPFAKLRAQQGCLSTVPGPWPHYDLSSEQREWVTRALPQAEHPQLDDPQRINKTLATFNCIACHDRDGLGQIPPERKVLFSGTQPNLGDQGRVPPPLSHVGAKLQPRWLADVLLHGKRQRSYLDAAMPQFGEANVGHLVELFDKVDTLETIPIPNVPNLQESKVAGHEMVGTDGLSCIVCHEFNGQKSGEISAVDIARAPERLKKNWFHLYLRQPSRFYPTVIMPTYWPDGQSVRTNLLGGDAGQQIEALWNYLADGVRAKKPIGLSRESNELRVGDVTEICRGQSPAGYRGIGVGYPERIHLAFDAGEMALRQLWKGEFANVDFGHFRPRGTDLITLPPGIPFHRLQSLDDTWPRKGKSNHAFPQDLGYQFRGYHLDRDRRPTLLYRYGEIAVEDFFEDVRGQDGNPFFKRTLRFETTTDSAPFHFRAAAGPKIVRHSERHFAIDKLQLRITSHHTGVVREGETGDVLIPLTAPKGRSTLTLEYQW